MKDQHSVRSRRGWAAALLLACTVGALCVDQLSSLSKEELFTRFDWKRQESGFWAGTGIFASGKLKDATVEEIMDVATLDAIRSNGKMVNWGDHKGSSMWNVAAQSEARPDKGLQYTFLQYVVGEGMKIRRYYELRITKEEEGMLLVAKLPVCIDGEKGKKVHFYDSEPCSWSSELKSAPGILEKARKYCEEKKPNMSFAPLTVRAEWKMEEKKAGG